MSFFKRGSVIGVSLLSLFNRSKLVYYCIGGLRNYSEEILSPVSVCKTKGGSENVVEM